MLNIIWPIFILLSFAFAIANGTIDKVNESIFESAENTVQLTITFFGTICLWNGIMKIAQKTSIIESLTKLLRPLINFLFPEYKKNEEMKQQISMNVIANILGLGNAATPMGLKVMRSMQEDNMKKDTITNSMAMFIVINTASLQIIPTTVIAIRSSLSSNNPTNIILPVLSSTLAAFVAVVIATKIFIKLQSKK